MHECIGLRFIGSVVTGAHWVFTLVPLLCIIDCLLYGNELDCFLKFMIFFGAGSSTIFWVFVLEIGKFLWIQGNNVFNSWAEVGFEGSKKEKMEMKKFRKSCKLILIHHGKSFVMGRMTPFIYFTTSIKYI